MRLTLAEAMEKQKIQLRPQVYEFEDIRVDATKPRSRWIGNKIRPVMPGAYGASGPGETVGAAFAFKIKPGRTSPVRPLYARMFLRDNPNDSLRIRCSFMDVNSEGQPGKNLIPKTYILTSDQKKGWVTCDFTDDLLLIKEKEFFLIFEWLKMKGSENDAPMFGMGVATQSHPFIKAHPFGTWIKEGWAKNLVYSLKVEY